MKHTLPSHVISPQACVGKITVLYDGGVTPPNCFSVAEVEWDGDPRIAIRWNVSENEWDDADKKSGKVLCKGMPTSHGVPVWFILPDVLCEDDSDLMSKVRELQKKAQRG